MSLTPEVRCALEELGRSFSKSPVTVQEDGSGGAVVVLTVPLGPPFEQLETWIGFHVTFQYPSATVYPHFVRPDLKRLDGKPHGAGISPATFRNGPALQLSRRTKPEGAGVETALLKLHKVLDWLVTQP